MYQPIKLSYQYDSFEPGLTEDNFKNHYENHYLKYLNNLNNLLEKENFSFSYPIEDLYKNIDSFKIAVRDDILYQAGGVINHELFFTSLSPVKRIVPEPLRSKLVLKYGSIENFEDQLLDLALNLPGSGYTFLAVNKEGDLILFNLANQDSPYLFGMTPIMAYDIWEHAYYLDYRNNRKDYLKNMFPYLDYYNMNERYKRSISKK